MINEKLINMFLQNVEQEDLIRGVKELLNHLKIQSNYAFEKQVNNFINIVGGDKPISINERVNLANNTDYWLYLSIHANSNDSPKAGTGVEAFSNGEWSLSNNILNDLQSEFGLVKRSSPIVTPYYNRNIANSSLLEIGFINNDFDRNIMLTEQDKIADIIANNIINDYNAKHSDSKVVTQELLMYDGNKIPVKVTYY